MNISLFIRKLIFIFAVMENNKVIPFLNGLLTGLCLGLFMASWAISEVNKELDKVIEERKLKTPEELQAEINTLKLVLKEYD